MPIILYIGKNIKEYENNSEKIIKEHMISGNIRCELCVKPMAVHSNYTRGIKETGQKIKIKIVWCSKCKKWHALLPDFLLPNKHYSGDEIEGVIIDSATETVSRIETEASESTVRRWIDQVSDKIRQAVSILKYLFRRLGRSISEIAIDSAYAYIELEQVLEMAPKAVKCSGNKLGLANLWLGTNHIKAYI
jgi:hypothetical protein